MKKPALPPNESQRLHALKGYRILDTPPEEAFDDLTRLAAQICDTPVALIGFLDQTRQWIKSSVGFCAQDIPRDVAFSAYAILQSDLWTIEDAATDPRFAQHPLVVGEPQVRFYAGMPLFTPIGQYPVGTLCVMDQRSRQLTQQQAEALRILSHQVVTHLELRLNLNELKRSVASHLRAEEALRQAEEKYRGIFENVMEGIYQTTPDGHYISANPMLARIYGYPSSEQLIVSISDIQHQLYVHEERRLEFKRMMETSGTVERFESQVRRRNGEIIWISESARAVHDPEGKILYYEGVVEDISERKRTEEALRDSEVLYHSLVEGLPQNIFRKNRQGQFTFANGRFCDTLGRSLEDIVGRTDFDFFPEDLARKYQADDQAVMQSEQNLETVEGHQKSDGGKIYVQVVKTPLYDALGNVIGIQGIFWDVSERKRMEEALNHERDLLRALLDNIPDAIYFKDRESRFIRLGKVLAKAFGLENPEDATGKADFDFFSREHAQAAFDDEQWIIRTGEPIIGKTERETWPGRKDTFVLTTKMPLHNENGEIIGTFGISKDITQLKETENELAKARDAAVQSAQIKAEFLANMSHEIRTPMNCIIGMSGLLTDTALTEEQSDFVRTIRTSADALLTLINDILDFSKVEAGKLSVETIEFDLLETVESTVELLAERAEDKGIELVSYVPPGLPCQRRGDPGRLRQILTNLIGNAIKFTEEGEVVVRVQAAERQSTERMEGIQVEVVDTGIGIAPEARDRLFQAFTQADGSLTRKYGGTGLGLAISKQLVELMGGSVGVSSTPGKGSTFWFWMPLEIASGPPPARPEAVEVLHQARALIVDDNPTTRSVFRELTQAWQMRSETATGAGEALTRLLAAPPDDPFKLVITDLQMPDMDGLSLAQEIRRNTQLRQPRILMLTNLGLHLDATAWRGVGVDAYHVKPIKQLRFRDCLSAMLTGSLPERSPDLDASPCVQRQLPSKARLRSLRVLLAEDNVVNQMIALRQLRKIGYGADTAANGKEVLKAVEDVPYDVILMDCQMPELDGYATSRRIRQMEAAAADRGRPPVYIIALTANALSGDREVCLAAGMDDYVSKPVRLPDLQNALERATHKVSPPGAPPAPKDESVEEEVPELDAQALDRLRDLQEPGEPDMLLELVELFLQDAPNRLQAIWDSLDQNHAEAVVQATHSLKGSANNIGARRLANLCAQMESAAKTGDLAAAAQRRKDLHQQYERVCFLLEQEAKKQKSVAP